jgi:hypothetical protein
MHRPLRVVWATDTGLSAHTYKVNAALGEA